MPQNRSLYRMFPQWLMMLVDIDDADIENPRTWPHFNNITNVVATYYYDLDIGEGFYEKN